MRGKPILFAAVFVLFSMASSFATAQCVLEKVGELPVQMHGARRLRPVVAVEINGVRANLIFDTGASLTTVFKASSQKLGLRSEPLPEGFEVRSSGQAVKAEFAVADHFVFPGRSTPSAKVVLVVADFGPGIDGLLGQDQIGDLDVEVDLHGGVIRLFSAKHCSGLPGDWAGADASSAVELEPPVRSSRPFGRVGVNGVALRAMFDTGTPTTTLTADAASRAGAVEGGRDVKDAGWSGGVGATLLPTSVAVFSDLTIGREHVRDVTLNFVKKPGASADLLIGADYFVTHRVLISRSRNRLYAAPVGGGGLAAQPASSPTSP